MEKIQSIGLEEAMEQAQNSYYGNSSPIPESFDTGEDLEDE